MSAVRNLTCMVAAVAAVLCFGAFASAGSRDGCDSRWITFESEPSDFVKVMCVFDDGGGEALYVGGNFTSIGNQSISYLARWDGVSWQAVGQGVNGRVDALAVFDDGSGPALYVGGDFSFAGGIEAANIARWDGSSWHTLGSGVGGPVTAIAEYEGESGRQLLVSGNFTQVGGEQILFLASWDGAAWSAFGPGLNAPAYAFAMFDDGSGPALYIGGAFTTVGQLQVKRIVRFDGEEWSWLAVDNVPGFNGLVENLVVHDDGHGEALFVSGVFTLASDLPARRLVKWDGQGWTEVGGGLNQRVRAMTLFDSGSGPELFIGGLFTLAGSTEAAFYSARWDGEQWYWLNGGTNAFVLSLTPWNVDGEPALFVGGGFSQAGEAGGMPARNLAIWKPCGSGPAACPADLNGDGFVSLPDLNLVLSNFGSNSDAGDANGDGFVNLIDLNVVLSQFGTGCP